MSLTVLVISVGPHSRNEKGFKKKSAIKSVEDPYLKEQKDKEN